MKSMREKNTAADVPLQEHSTKNTLITYYVKINPIATDGVYPSLTWFELGV